MSLLFGCSSVQSLLINQHNLLPFRPRCHSLFPTLSTPADSDSGHTPLWVLPAVCCHWPLNAWYEPTDGWAFSLILDAGPTLLSKDLNDGWINGGWVDMWMYDLLTWTQVETTFYSPSQSMGREYEKPSVVTCPWLWTGAWHGLELLIHLLSDCF